MPTSNNSPFGGLPSLPDAGSLTSPWQGETEDTMYWIDNDDYYIQVVRAGNGLDIAVNLDDQCYLGHQRRGESVVLNPALAPEWQGPVQEILHDERHFRPFVAPEWVEDLAQYCA